MDRKHDPAAGGMTTAEPASSLEDVQALRARVAQLERELAGRKELETAVQESGQRFAALVDSAMDAIIGVDSQQRILLFNRAAEAMFRCPVAEALGSDLGRFIPMRFRGDHAEHVRRFGETGTTSRAMGRLGALSGVRSDGVEFPIEASISQMEVSGEKFFTVILRDISERKRLEEKLQRMNEELEKRVEERTAELMHANEALLRSNLELQQFAYIAAHDLQTPLRSISGFAQLLHKEYAGHLDGNADDLIRRVVDNALRMRTLIQDLLVYSRIDSLGRPLRPVSLDHLFGEVVAALEPRISELRAEVTRDELPVVLGDRSQLAQVLHNLVDNGLKYHGSDPPRVHVGAEPQGEEWVVSVRDNGIGIAPRHHRRIFDIFRRLHTQQAYPGTGIGLALCRKVVERHGGRIWVESEPGKGSVFRFTLPINKTEVSR
ncbi:MAG TPA: ATP-binding protein [Rhodocyclaceae bacterium]|nr:ATP-binding protein [Rhodocyclaceae bacterium]